MSPSHSQKQRQDAMEQVYVSDKGDDKNDGLSLEAPIKSLKRLCVLWSGRELVLMEGRETFNKLVDEMVVSVRFAKAASKNENRASRCSAKHVQTTLRGCPIPTPRRTGATISADTPPSATTSKMSEGKAKGPGD